ncbi:uncharacterized protein N7459_008028 [Penicillium hispanicum]|uniref:uncharacterized protein n=1 Tax=Penicillium hispanicum TaxID=1080232 RepID=UPI00253FA365|nr:uncharacterized protein N7459_008028 [Penicillium hispanicum]KAJ5573601.1 hypothetical protein N7459_008028 [Penicillium hispanicum]
MTSGSCACRYIRYITTIAPTELVNCHCVECRKQAGAPYQSWVHFPIDSIQWQANPTVWESSESASRSFCPRCGSTLTMNLKNDASNVSVAAGTLDDVKTQVPHLVAHIFLREKASWFEVPNDGAKRCEEWTCTMEDVGQVDDEG